MSQQSQRNLEALRVLKGLRTVRDVQRATGVSTVTLHRLERGDPVAALTVEKYAEAVGLYPEAVEGLRKGSLRLFVELRKKNGRKVRGFSAECGR